MKPLSYMDFRALYAVAVKSSVFLRRKFLDFWQIFGIIGPMLGIIGNLLPNLVHCDWASPQIHLIPRGDNAVANHSKYSWTTTPNTFNHPSPFVISPHRHSRFCEQIVMKYAPACE